MILVDLEQRSEAWHLWRAAGITATQAVAVSGHSPHQTPWQVWAEKTGRVIPRDLSRNPLVNYGIAHEDEVRELFMRETNDIVLPACGECETNRIFRASFDGLNSAGEPVEIKCPGPSVLEDVMANGEQSAAYGLYRWQVQWQLLVANAPRGWLVFYLGNGAIRVFEVIRDEDAIRQMQASCLAFWQTNILGDKEPVKLPERDVYVPQGQDRLAWERAALEYRQVKTKMDRLTVRLEDSKGRLVSLMGAFRSAESSGVPVSRYTQKGGIDYKKVFLDRGLELTEDELQNCRRMPVQVCKVSFLTDPQSFEKGERLTHEENFQESDRNNLCW